MSTYEALSLMIAFAVLVVMILGTKNNHPAFSPSRMVIFHITFMKLGSHSMESATLCLYFTTLPFYCQSADPITIFHTIHSVMRINASSRKITEVHICPVRQSIRQ